MKIINKQLIFIKSHLHLMKVSVHFKKIFIPLVKVFQTKRYSPFHPISLFSIHPNTSQTWICYYNLHEYALSSNSILIYVFGGILIIAPFPIQDYATTSWYRTLELNGSFFSIIWCQSICSLSTYLDQIKNWKQKPI